MKKIYALGLLCCLVTTACTSEEVAPPPEEPKWIAGQEGSMVLTSANPQFNRLVRCWPDVKGHDCLVVAEWPSFTEMERYTSAKLSTSAGGVPNGYECSISITTGVVHENIKRNGQVLVSNGFDGLADGTPWTKDHVETFMKANGITPKTRYFSCKAVATLIQGGSIESLNSTALTHGMLGD